MRSLAWTQILGLLLVLQAGLFAGAGARAAVSWDVSASIPSGAGFLGPGDLVVLDITLRSDGEPVQALGGSVYGPDASAFELVGGTGSGTVLVQLATGPGSGFGGIQGRSEVEVNPAGGDAGFVFAGHVTCCAATATGARDVSPVTGLAGGPQFQVVLRFVPPAEGEYTLFVGSNHPSGGVFGSGGTSVDSTDASISVTYLVPEPGTALLIGAGLSFLARPRRSRSPVDPSTGRPR